MRLLVITQKVDTDDGVLGFFHGWIARMAARAESIEVICLEKGSESLPLNVHISSLGKEKKPSRLSYVFNFFRHLIRLHGSYDAVFVHMNQEYVLLGGWYWRLAGLPVYFWRNHPRGSLLTRLAVVLSTAVFCTSRSSYTARFAKTSIMPVGVDTAVFKSEAGVVRKKYSVCVVGRIAPIKGINIALEAMRELVSSGTQVSLSIVGSPLEEDALYYERLKDFVAENGLGSCVRFCDQMPQKELVRLYSEHEICLNLTEDGSFDKTIVEAAACGAVPVVSGGAVASLLPEQCRTVRTAAGVARSIHRLLDAKERLLLQDALVDFVAANSLDRLIENLFEKIEPRTYLKNSG